MPKSFEKASQGAKNEAKDSSSEPHKRAPIELEDNEQIERSKKILEAKSKFYDRMIASGGSVNSDDNCLVMFNAKKQSEKVECSSSSDESDGEGRDPLEEDQGEWVEYTDSLGRTRKCLRSDLEFFKKRDEALVRERDEDKVTCSEITLPFLSKIYSHFKDPSAQPHAPIAEDISRSDSESEDELLKTGRQIQQMRDQWEQQEEENKDKEFVHYQDVLFDEARTHGVSYFQFSKDAEERLKQQKELETVRKATLSAQKEREEQRSARERIIAERVLAAKNRQRARLGLPPLEKLQPPAASEVDPEEVTKNSAEKSEQETMRELERRSHLRPWDEGKEGTSHLAPMKQKEEEEVEWKYQGQREPMSQEEWNAKKREERISEFAPATKKKRPTKESDLESPVKQSIPPVAPEMELADDVEEEERPGLYFTTKKKLKRKNYQPEEASSRGGVEVPPPPTFDYPVAPLLGLSKKPKNENLASSIEAGLKFLRNQTDKSQSSSQSLWGANASYGNE